MAADRIVTSRGEHHESFAVGRVHVLVLARQGVAPRDIDAGFAARRAMEARYPTGHVVIVDTRTLTGLLDGETRALLAAHARTQRAGHVRARGVVVPADRDAAQLVRAFWTAYTQAPGMKCPDRFVETLEAACAFVTPFVPEEPIDVAAIISHVAASRAELEAPVHAPANP